MSSFPVPLDTRVDGRVLIGGAWFEKDERLGSFNPATGLLLGTVPLCDAADVARAVGAARNAQPAWAAMETRHRFGFLDRVKGLLIQEGDALASLITRENGKPLLESHLVDVSGAVDFAAGLIGEGEEWLRDRRVRATNPALWGKKITVRKVPLGVIGVISPWNLPLAIPMGQILPALAAGNTVVFKPSELTPLTGVKIATLFHRAGVPPGVFNLVTGGRETGAALVECPIDGMLFTGSTATGQAIQKRLGERLIPAQMELGGKDAFLVLDDAPFERTLKGALWSGLFGTGQACSSSERYFVPRSWMPRFTEALAEKARRLKVGDGMDETVQLGPLVSEEQRDKVHAQVVEAVAMGAKLLCGGEKPEGPGFFYPPTVLAEVPLACKLLREETFGPVIPVAAYDDLEQAVARCNDSDYGLSATIWTADPARGEALARDLRVGSVWVNDSSFTHSQARCPWGGMKKSGLGRTHWLGSLHELTAPQVIASGSARGEGELWWYPYGGDGIELFQRARRMQGEGWGGKLRHVLPLLRAFWSVRRTR